MSTSAADIAVELAATRLAIVGAVETLVGTSPIFDTEGEKAFEEWAFDVPVEISDGFRGRVVDRSREVEEQMLASVGRFLLSRAERYRSLRLRAESLPQGESDG